MDDYTVMEDIDSEGELSTKYLIYSLDSDSYGVDIQYITDIIEMTVITKVPEVPDYIMGIINLRGKVIPVIDIRIRFHKEPAVYNNRTNIVVLDLEGIVVGIIVDTVVEVIDIMDDDISPPPSVNGEAYISGIARLQSGVKLIVDCRTLVGIDEIMQTD